MREDDECREDRILDGIIRQQNTTGDSLTDVFKMSLSSSAETLLLTFSKALAIRLVSTEESLGSVEYFLVLNNPIIYLKCCARVYREDTVRHEFVLYFLLLSGAISLGLTLSFWNK